MRRMKKQLFKDKIVIKETIINPPIGYQGGTQLIFSVNSGPSVIYTVNVIAKSLDEAKDGMEFVLKHIPRIEQSKGLRVD